MAFVSQREMTMPSYLKVQMRPKGYEFNQVESISGSGCGQSCRVPGHRRDVKFWRLSDGNYGLGASGTSCDAATTPRQVPRVVDCHFIRWSFEIASYYYDCLLTSEMHSDAATSKPKRRSQDETGAEPALFPSDS